MLPSVNLISNRRRMVYHVYIAQTPEQIRAVRGSVDAWLRRHPKDTIVQRAARQLKISEDRLREAGKWY